MKKQLIGLALAVALMVAASLGAVILSYRTAVPVLTMQSAASQSGGDPAALEKLSAAQTFSATDAKYTVRPGTWVFTDALGRTSLTNADVGNPKTGKTLMLFYWDWHTTDNGSARTSRIPVNVQKLMEEHPEIKNNYSSPYWGDNSTHAYFWNEPIYGYYASTDAWVIRKQAELFANAGVDAIIFDNTNGSFTWRNAYTAICDTYVTSKQNGVNVPKISFMLPFSSGDHTISQVTSLYQNAYTKSAWSGLWYTLGGKPFIMAHMTGVSSVYTNYFSYRAGHGAYVASGVSGGTYWGWLNTYPQPVFGSATSVKQMTVSVAQNYTYKNLANASYAICAMNGKFIQGRSYTTNGYSNVYDSNGNLKDPSSSLYGYNFAQQFEYALSKNPDVLLVTGWNEWWAERQTSWPSGAYNNTANALPDTFNDEYSRDIEPTKGALKDNYYYQMVNFIRRYKGVEAIPLPGKAQAIDIFGPVSQWDSVPLYFAAYANNIGNRAASGYGLVYYTEKSGRNDIIGAQISQDQEYLYFLVECMNDITAYDGGRWMNILIDSNQSAKGWETFDYVINKTTPTATKCYVERFTGNGYESTVVGTVDYAVDGRYLQVKVPKTMLGISGYDYTLNFSVTDNVHDEGNYSVYSGDIMDFYISGDVAPGGRFKYSYISTTANATAGLTDLEKLTTSPWYEYRYDEVKGLRYAETVPMNGFAKNLSSTGWTRTATIYIPEDKNYTASDVIGVFEICGTTAGTWNTGVHYNLGTGKVESSAPALFASPAVSVATTPSGWLFFAEIFDGTTQSVYVNGTLVYRATVLNSQTGKTYLGTAGQGTLLLGGKATAGSETVSGNYLEYGVILWKTAGYTTKTTAAVITALTERAKADFGTSTEFLYSYEEVLDSDWYRYDYTDTEAGTLQNSVKVASAFQYPMDLNSWTKVALYRIPDVEYASGDSILVFGIKSTSSAGKADLITGVVYDLATGVTDLSYPDGYRVTYQAAKKVTGNAYFVNTFTGGTMKVWLNGTLVLSATAVENLSSAMTAAAQVQIFLNVFARYNTARISYVSQYTKYGVTLDYTVGYGRAADDAAALRFYQEYRKTQPDTSGNYRDVLAAEWYQFGYPAGLPAPVTQSVPAFSGEGWTHEVVYRIPVGSYGLGDFVTVVGEYAMDNGFWFAGIRYQLATGIVSSANPGLFPLTTQERKAVAATEYLHFVETFDGTTQKVYVNGELAYTATLRGPWNPLGDGRNTVLLGANAAVGVTAAEATDVAAAYSVNLISANGYCMTADEDAVRTLYEAFADTLR